MKKIIVLTLVLCLVLSAFAWAGTTNIDPSKLQKENGKIIYNEGVKDSFVVSNEMCGALITQLYNHYNTAGFTNQTVSQALTFVMNDMFSNIDTSTATKYAYMQPIYDSFLASLQASPSSAETFVARLTSVASPSNINTLLNGTDKYRQNLVIGADGSMFFALTDAAKLGANGASDYTTGYGYGRELGAWAGGTNVTDELGGSYYAGRCLLSYPQTAAARENAIYNMGDKYKDMNASGSLKKKASYKAFAVAWASPIVLDLDGDGSLQASKGVWLPHSVFIEGSPRAMFDINGDGFDDITEWVGPNDGILLLPGESNEIDVSSFAGNSGGYTDGYQKLSTYDTNNDGVVSGTELAGFNVWADANGNAKVDTGEVKTVQSLNISEIAVNHKAYTSSFVQDGARKWSFDWWPAYMSIEKVAVK